jgi:cytidylate kinase
LLHYQRSQVGLARDQGFAGVIMEGRDIGSVVLPDAEVRVFLEADADAALAPGAPRKASADAVDARDRLDSTRQNAPLMCAPVRIGSTTPTGRSRRWSRSIVALVGAARRRSSPRRT